MTRATEAGDWSLYVLRCADGSLYAGISPDVPARIAAHEAGRGSRYLRGRQPLELAAEARVGSRAAASRAEYRFKRLDRRRKLALIADGRGLPRFVAEVLADA